MQRNLRTYWNSSLEQLEGRTLLAASGLASLSVMNVVHYNGGTVLRNIEYADVGGHQQALDVLKPSGPAPSGGWPVIVAIHGGGWRKFSKEEYEPTVAPLTRLGFEIVAPDYPLSKPSQPSWPDNFESVEDAVRWVRTNAGQISANPNRIAAMGESAGGHLAALLGTDSSTDENGVSSQVEAVVDFYGPTDLPALFQQSRDASFAIHQFLGGPPSTNASSYEEASPVNHIALGDPPFLIVQGTADNLVVPSQSTELANDLTAAGVPNHLILVPGAGHGFGLNVPGEDLLHRVASFLKQAMPVR